MRIVSAHDLLLESRYYREYNDTNLSTGLGSRKFYFNLKLSSAKLDVQDLISQYYSLDLYFPNTPLNALHQTSCPLVSKGGKRTTERQVSAADTHPAGALRRLQVSVNFLIY